LRERGRGEIVFPPNEAKRLLEIKRLLFFIMLESQEVFENKGVKP
jgi:hypothetical protein